MGRRPGAVWGPSQRRIWPITVNGLYAAVMQVTVGARGCAAGQARRSSEHRRVSRATAVAALCSPSWMFAACCATRASLAALSFDGSEFPAARSTSEARRPGEQAAARAGDAVYHHLGLSFRYSRIA